MKMNIEYRTLGGQRRLEVNANGAIMPGTGPVNLRAMGCPEHIARKVETGQVLRRAAVAMSVTPAPDADETRRARAAQIGQQIAEDNRKLQADADLKARMQTAAGIVHGRR
jgi:hypothetical protein